MKKTRALSILFIFALLISVTPIVSAASISNDIYNTNSGLWVVKTNTEGSIYLENTQTGEKMERAYRQDEFGNVVEIDLANYAQTLNQSLPNFAFPQSQLNSANDTSFSTAESFPVIYDTYTESSKYVGIGSAVKVTADFRGPAQLSYGSSATIGDSFGGSISITGGKKDAIVGGATFNWQHSISSNDNFGATFPVPSGRLGYVQFRPYLNVSMGTLREIIVIEGAIQSDISYSAFGQCPIKLSNGFADGVYELMLK